MGALDQVKSYFTGDVKIDNPEIRQALKDAFPNLAKAGSEFDDFEYLPSSYIQEKIVPALMTMDENRLQVFKSATEKTSSDLHSLTRDIESSLRYKPRDGNALPSNQQIPDRLKSSAKGIFKDAQNFLTEIASLRTDAEKEQALMAEIIASANRSVVKFDRYVQRGNGIQYGDRANDWFEIDSKNVNIRRPENSKKIRHNVENVPKIDFTTVVNEVVAMAQDPGVNVNIDGKLQPVGSGTRLEKLAYLASWMSALEEGTDKVLPNMLAEAATSTAVTAVDTVTGTAWDMATGIMGEYPLFTTATLAMFGYATWKTGNLLKGIINIPSVPFKLAAKAAGVFGATKGLAPHIQKFADIISFKDATSAPGAPGATSAAGPKTPNRFVEVNPADLKDFKPGEANHEEYYKKTVEKIKGLGATPPAPAAGAPAPAPAITPAEVTRRTTLFMRLDQEYRGGKMSLAEYLKRTEDIMAGRGKVLVVDHTGRVDKAESVKNIKQRVADRTPGLSSFTRNNPNGSAAASVSAMQEAKKRIKGASYESVDYAGAKVEFADAANRMLFEEFRDKLQKYTAMQEWDANDRKIITNTNEVTRLQNDINSRIAIGTPAAILQGQINALIGSAPTVTTISTHPTTGAISTSTIPNPQIDILVQQLGRLNPDVPGLYDTINKLNVENAKLRGSTLAYIPTAGIRGSFHIDIKALKLQISSAGALAGTPPGLIQRINTAVGPGTIPESAFDPKALKIDKIRLLEVIKTALKK